jgi:hypothetical protein
MQPLSYLKNVPVTVDCPFEGLVLAEEVGNVARMRAGLLG